MKKLFTQLALEHLKNQDIQAAFEKDLSTSDVYLTLRWTPNRRILIYRLHVTIGTQNLDLLKGTAVNDKSGAYTFLIGAYADKVLLDINVGVMGLVAVPKLIAIVSQNNPDRAYQVSPVPPAYPHKIDTGTQLDIPFKYQVQ